MTRGSHIFFEEESHETLGIFNASEILGFKRFDGLPDVAYAFRPGLRSHRRLG